MTRLCGHPSGIYGAMPCPREHGHDGACFWVVVFEQGYSWRVQVFKGPPLERQKVCTGGFTAEPSAHDVLFLLRTVTAARLLGHKIRAETIANPAPPPEPLPARVREARHYHRPLPTTPVESVASRAARAAAASVRP